MQVQDLEIFSSSPFLFWVKDQHGRYVWCNQALRHFAGQDVIGKTDHDLPWADQADEFMEVDQEVFATGKPHRLHESAEALFHGQKLCVCKWLDNFEGRKLCFGISFAVEQEVPQKGRVKEHAHA